MRFLSRFFARATLHRLFGRWGWLPLAGLFLLAYTVESRADDLWEPRDPPVAQGQFFQHAQNAANYAVTFMGYYTNCWAGWTCGSRFAEIQSYSGAWAYGQLRVNRCPNTGGGPCEEVSGGNFSLLQHGNPDVEECSDCVEYDCPAENEFLFNRMMPPGSSGSYCVPVPGQPPGYGCGAVGAMSAGFVDPLTSQTYVRIRFTSTGEMCTVGSGSPEIQPPPDTSNITCVVMSGNTHCWNNQDDSGCQFVNGEKWCMSDVEHTGVITAQGQVLAPPVPPAVVDSTGDPVPPTTQIDGATGSGQVVNHYDHSTVSTNYTAGFVVGNPAQSGSGVPGGGSSGDGGPGSGSGSGDGDGDGPSGSLSGGVGCDSPPVCDGDPLLCGIVAQQWRTRCVDAVSDADIATLAGESAGTTQESLIGELVEGDGTGQGVQDVFSSYFTGASDWWSRPTVCVTDPVIQLPAAFGGSARTIALSEWCTVLAMLGQLILALSWLQALRIIVGAV